MSELLTLKESIANVEHNLKQDIKLNADNLLLQVKSLESTFNHTAEGIKEDVLAIRNHVIGVLVKENRELRSRVQTLEGRMIKVEKQVNRNEQNSRKANFELDGIPESITQDQLAPNIVEIVNTISNEKITLNDVEACHRLRTAKKPSPTIVKMKRNHVEMIRKNKKNLMGIGNKVNSLNGSKIFMNYNLSPSMRTIDFNARKLLKEKLVSGAWFSNSSVRIKCLDGRVINIDHEHDLFDSFPSYEGFTFDTVFYDRVANHDMEQYDDLVEMDALTLEVDSGSPSTVVTNL